MYFVGLDLGQKRDPSAVVVMVQEVYHRRAFFGRGSFDKLLVRYAQRMTLGMPYPRIVERVREVVRSEELLGNCALAVDATGLGAPVVDMLGAARLGCEVCAVTITGGERGSGWSVPKRDLLAGVQVLLEEGRLRIAQMKETGGWWRNW